MVTHRMSDEFSIVQNMKVNNMAQNFSQSKAYRDLTVDMVYDLTNHECWELFITLRWGSYENICCPMPGCGSLEKNFISTRKQWRCKKCDHTYSVTSRTKFHSHKISIKKIIRLVFEFITSPQGQSANAKSSKFGMTVKSARILFLKFREVLFDTNDRLKLSGTVHVDGLHICGKPRKANKRQKADAVAINAKLRNRKASITPTPIPVMESWNAKKFKNRRIILALAELNTKNSDSKGTKKVFAVVVRAETASEVIPIINKMVEKGSCIMSDSSNAYGKLALNYVHKTVNHSKEYMNLDGTNNNQAESFFSRIRRAEFGVLNGMRHPYLYLYLAEFVWRANANKMTLKEKFEDVLKKALVLPAHSVFKNYDDKTTNQNRNEVLYG